MTCHFISGKLTWIWNKLKNRHLILFRISICFNTRKKRFRETFWNISICFTFQWNVLKYPISFCFESYSFCFTFQRNKMRYISFCFNLILFRNTGTRTVFSIIIKNSAFFVCNFWALYLSRKWKIIVFSRGRSISP